MRAVIQRVSEASVHIADRLESSIEVGLLIFLGIEKSDDIQEAEWLAKKVTALRIFNDKEGKMNLNIRDVNGSILLVSQFTLHAKTKKGNRPSFARAAQPDEALKLYEESIDVFERTLGQPIQTGQFGAEMDVRLINDGPVTILIDTKNKE